MKLRIHFVCLPTAIIVFTVLHLPCGNARSLADTANVLASTEAISKSNSTNKIQNATTADSSNGRRVNDTTNQNQNQMQAQSKTATVITHILRKKRETEAELPYDFHTTHMPCDMDVPGVHNIIESFPNQCIWATNNRFAHEGFFRVYKSYQLEGHFFNQYHIRLTRYETDPPYFEYV